MARCCAIWCAKMGRVGAMATVLGGLDLVTVDLGVGLEVGDLGAALTIPTTAPTMAALMIAGLAMAVPTMAGPIIAEATMIDPCDLMGAA